MDRLDIKNKIKRQTVFRDKQKRRLKDEIATRSARRKAERADPSLGEERRRLNVPDTIENQREADAQTLPAVDEADAEYSAALTEDKFSEALSVDARPPKILITTSAAPCKFSYEFSKDLLSVFPNAEFIPRRQQKGYEVPKICTWAVKRRFTDVLILNEDHKLPNALTVIHLPSGPTAYFRLTNPVTISRLHGHARPSKHYPELVLNNFGTRLGYTVGRMFQALFPVMPEFEGRQVATLHNQRDYLFFRRHRYDFRSTKKAALQEIGPRFTLKLLEMKNGLPKLQHGTIAEMARRGRDEDGSEEAQEELSLAGQDEYAFKLRPEMQKSRRRFYL